ncbi:MAG: methyltransferase domain-containing protein [Candidatus Bathyarchaeia archaeon]
MKDIALKDDQWEYLERGPAKHLHRHRLNAILEILRSVSLLKTNVRVLDLGCGDGVITLNVARLTELATGSIVGLDMDIVRLKRAKRKDYDKIVSFCKGTALSLPFQEDIFDIIILHHVIEHIKNDKKVIAECYRVLSNHGLLIIGIPNEGGFIGNIIRLCHKEAYSKSEHVNFYSAESISRMLTENGFKIVSLKRFGFLVPIMIIHYIVLRTKPLFEFGNFLTQFIKFTADSLLLLAEADKIK